MALIIKSDETQKLIQELADLTGETMTDAVAEAVRERLRRIRHEQGVGLEQRLLLIGKECAAHLKTPYRDVDHADFLYDNKGLPR